MASTSTPNATQVRQILAGINKCAELWGELRVLTRSYPSMKTDVFHDVAYSFETILQDGQKSIKEFLDVPKNQAAFNQGDGKSILDCTKIYVYILTCNSRSIICSSASSNANAKPSFEDSRRHQASVGPGIPRSVLLKIQEDVHKSRRHTRYWKNNGPPR